VTLAVPPTLLRESDPARGWVLRVPTVPLPVNQKSRIQVRMKRTVQVNVKMTQEDFGQLRKAAEKRWPDAVMTNSGMILGLAKIAARGVLAKGKRKAKI